MIKVMYKRNKNEVAKIGQPHFDNKTVLKN